MSTDSTELTFIRCPSCRSLVPAVSTRCRMCGASLDAAATQGEGGEPRAAGRVRQRTMSNTPQSEFGQAVDRLRDEVNTGSTEGAATTEYDDPLALYSEGEAGADAATDVAASVTASPSAAADVDESDPLGDYLADDQASDQGAAASEQDDLDDDEYDPFAESDEDEQAAAADEVSKAAVPAEIVAKPAAPVANANNGQAEGAKPRVIVESGSRRFGGGKAGLSFGAKPVSEERAPQRPVEARAHESAKSAKPVRDVDSTQLAKSGVETRAQDVKPREAHAERRRESGVKPSETKSGRLVGWMVSYEDPNGRAIELREGRFFVTASSLKPTDLVLADPSVSTPHAMVKVTSQGELEIQDLMSDRGVFLRQREGAAYQREGEEFSARNGDWIRFGDVEFLVSLIAHVGEK